MRERFDLRDFLRLSALYTFASAFPAVLQIVVLPFIEGAGRLGALDFAHIAISESISTFVGPLIIFSMGSGISRFYYDYRDRPGEVGRLYSSVLTGIVARGLLALAAAALLGDWLAARFTQEGLRDFGSYGYGAVAVGINRAVLTSAATLYRNERRVARFVGANLLAAAARTAFQLAGLFWFDMSFVGYVNGAAAGGGVVTLLILADAWRRAGVRYSFAMMRPVMRFAAPLFVFEMARWGVTYADRFFLESRPEQLAVYDTAQRFAAGLYVIFQGLYGAIQPDFFRFLKQGGAEAAEGIRRIGNVYMLQAQAIAIGLALPVIAYIRLCFETQLQEAAGLVTIVFAQYILLALNTLFSLAIIYRKRTDLYLAVNAAVLAVSLALNFALTRRYGPYGAVAAAYAANLAQLALLALIQRRVEPIAWNYRKTLWLPLGVVAAALAAEAAKLALGLGYLAAACGVAAVAAGGVGVVFRAEIGAAAGKIAAVSRKKTKNL